MHLAFFFVVVFFILFVLLWVQSLLLSCLIAFFLFFLFYPAVDALEKRKVPRAWAALIPLVIVIFSSTFLILILAPTIQHQIGLLKSEAPIYMDSFSRLMETLQVHIVSFHGPVDISDISEQFKEQASVWVTAFFNGLPRVISNSITILLLAPFLCYYMLYEGRTWIAKLKSLSPANISGHVDSLTEQISTQIGGFIRARAIETSVVIAITWLGLILTKSPYALLLAIVYGVFNIIPYIGAFLGAAPAFLIAFANGSESSVYFWLLVIFVLAQIIDTAILVPFLVARIVNLHPIIVVLAVLMGAQLMGILGMIISIPVAGVVKVTVTEIYKYIYSDKTHPS